MFPIFHIAICDDEPAVCKALRQIISNHLQASKFVITDFYNGEELCDKLQDGTHFSLIILDIELSNLNGVEVGHFIRNTLNDNNTQLLYISGKDGYAMELFDHRPINFLMKPINHEKLLSCVTQSLEICSNNDDFFTLQTSKNIVRVPFREIQYFETYNKKLIIHTSRENFECYQKLSEVLAVLPHPEFFQIHQSFIVHDPFVERIQYDKLTLVSGKTLSISQAYRKSVRELLMNRLPKGGK